MTRLAFLAVGLGAVFIFTAPLAAGRLGVGGDGGSGLGGGGSPNTGGTNGPQRDSDEAAAANVAGAAQMLGGVPRNFICAPPFGLGQGTVVACEVQNLMPRRDARIDAVMALSPTGPGSDGFMTESFSGLAVPLLMASGTNDGDPGEPANRVAAWDLYPPGQRWKIYIEDPGAKHTLFEGETDACVKVVPAARCTEMRGWLFSTGLAFLDGELRSDARARAWLGSGHIGIASGGDATLVGK